MRDRVLALALPGLLLAAAAVAQEGWTGIDDSLTFSAHEV